MSDLLKISNLSVELQAKPILSDVNLALAAGDILGLVGPSGCGKTTLLNTIAGFIEQNDGQIAICDYHTNKTCLAVTPDAMVPPEHRNIGMIFQDYALFPHLTVEQNICFGIDMLTRAEQQSRLTDLIKLLKLTDLESRYPHQLSGGQQQRVAIARALAPRPQLILLDEPFSNIDARLRNELMVEMRQLLKQLEMTAIFVTHNKDEVFTFADQIAVMHQGHLLQVGTPASVCQNPNCWQVADFLQLGSWLPVKGQPGTHHSAIGAIAFETELQAPQALQLLLKPQYIELCQESPANVKVDHISVTEQGFHYLLSSIQQDVDLAFEHLSFYSDALLSLDQEIAIKVKPHSFMVFGKPEA